MQSLRGHVKNGRIVLNEPTDRPEGTVVELVPLDEVLDDDERQALRREIEASIAETGPHDLIDAEDVLSELQTTG